MTTHAEARTGADAIWAEGLTKTFKKTHALRGVDLRGPVRDRDRPARPERGRQARYRVVTFLFLDARTRRQQPPLAVPAS